MITLHAKKRQQQRGVRAEALDLLLRHGECFREKGADIYKITAKSRKEMVAEGCCLQAIDKLKSVYAVTIGDAVITVAHKH
jgi:hypothetical protein